MGAANGLEHGKWYFRVVCNGCHQPFTFLRDLSNGTSVLIPYNLCRHLPYLPFTWPIPLKSH